MVGIQKKNFDNVIKLTNTLNQKIRDNDNFIWLNNIVIYFDFYETVYNYESIYENSFNIDIMLYQKVNNENILTAMINSNDLKTIKFVKGQKLINGKWEDCYI